MRKTNHIIHGVITLVTLGLWGPIWGVLALRNWSYNETRGYNDPQSRGQRAASAGLAPVIRYSSHGSFVLSKVTLVDDRPIVVEPGVKLSSGRTKSKDGPATYLPKAPAKKKTLYGEDSREFELDEELTEMFNGIGVTEPTDMQKIIDLALADASTASPRNRLLLSFGSYAQKLIADNKLEIHRS